jgi:hypothetical protein
MMIQELGKCDRNGQALEVSVILMFYFPEMGVSNAEIEEITNLWGQCCGESSSPPQDVNEHPNRIQMSMDIQVPTEQGTPP